MKFKSSILLASAASMMLLNACSADESLAPAKGDGVVTFTLSAPGAPASRAIADGDNASDLRVVVFDKDGNYLFTDSHAGLFSGTSQAQVDVNLVKGETYTVAFLVDNNFHYTITDGILAMDYAASVNANDDTRDAFYAARTITVSPTNLQQSITLVRPFAQINVGVNDKAAAEKALGKTIAKSSVSIDGPLFSELNLCTGAAQGAAISTVDFAMTALPAENLNAAGGTYDWLAMNYVLVDNAGSLMSAVKVTLYDADGVEATTETLAYTSVPGKRNFRTNILGSLAGATNWDVIVDANTYEPLEPVTGTTKTYEIANVGDLQQISSVIANTAHGEGTEIVFKLTADIDLGGATWAPLAGLWVTFDGQGHKLSNFNCAYNDTGKSGFFGYLGGGSLKDITLENVTVKGAQAGIVAGQIEGATLSNVTIAGNNVVEYLDTPGYHEDWAGIGAVTGVCIVDNLKGVTIASGATVTLKLNGMQTRIANCDEYAFYTGTNNNTDVNNFGTITYADATNVNGAMMAQAGGKVICVSPALPAGTDRATLSGKAGVYEDGSGDLVYIDNSAASVKAALASGATDIYFAPNATINWQAHFGVIPPAGVNVHGNGATIKGGECDFSVQDTDFAIGSTANINIYNLNQARIWGGNAKDCTMNVTMKNCSFIGGGIGGTAYSLGLVMLRNTTNPLATLNLTLEDCYCEGVQVGIHTIYKGTLTMNNCEFKNVGIPVNIAKKPADTTYAATITNCKFDACGIDPDTKPDKDAWNYAAPIRVVDNGGPANSVKLVVDGCEFTNTLSEWDILTMDYRSGKTWFPVDVTVTNSGTPTMRTE